MRSCKLLIVGAGAAGISASVAAWDAGCRDILLVDRGIRPGRLCDELGISRGLMTDLKMGRKKGVNAQTAQRIAAFFDVSVGYLLGEEGRDAVHFTHGTNAKDILEEVDVAFYGDFKELDEEQKEAVRDMVRLMRHRRAAQ